MKEDLTPDWSEVQAHHVPVSQELPWDITGGLLASGSHALLLSQHKCLLVVGKKDREWLPSRHVHAAVVLRFQTLKVENCSLPIRTHHHWVLEGHCFELLSPCLPLTPISHSYSFPPYV